MSDGVSVYGDMFPIGAGGQLVHFPGGAGRLRRGGGQDGPRRAGRTLPQHVRIVRGDHRPPLQRLHRRPDQHATGRREAHPDHQHGYGWWDCSTYDGEYPTCWSRSTSRDHLPRPIRTTPTGNSAVATPQSSCSASRMAVCGPSPRRSTPSPTNCSAPRNDGMVTPDF